MSLALHRSADFLADFALQYEWYLRKAGEDIAERYLAAVHATVQRLSMAPGLGRPRRFRHEALRGLRSFRIAPPFDRHLLFYRHTESELIVERVLHGARDLPRRLSQPHGSEH